MIPTTKVHGMRDARSGVTPFTDDAPERLAGLVAEHGIGNVAKAAGVSVQSVAKAIARMPMYESTKRRLLTVLV